LNSTTPIDLLSKIAELETENSRLQYELAEAKSSTQPERDQYQLLFQNLPLGAQEENYSSAKVQIDHLIRNGVEDLEAYFLENEDELISIVDDLEMISVNQALIDIHRAPSIKDFFEEEEKIEKWWSRQWLEYYAAEICHLADGVPYFGTERNDTTFDGKPFLSRIFTFIVAGYEDSWERVITLHEDITDRKKIELELRETQQELEKQVRLRTRELTDTKSSLLAFFRNSDTTISIKDVDSRFTIASRKFERLHGLIEDEATGKTPEEIYEPGMARLVRELDQEVVSKGKLIQREIAIPNTDPLILMLATKFPINNDEGEIIGVGTISIDISERKQIEQDLIDAKETADIANRVKSEFLAAMSHEIRTPMAGVIGMSNLLLDTDLSPQQLHWATSIKSSGNNLMSILNEILDQSKLEAGKLEISPTDVYLSSFVHDNINLFGPSIISKGLILDVKLNDNLPEAVHADSTRIGQVLSNFLSNALKFTSTGRIEVSVKPEPNEQNEFQIRFTVTDSGIGLTDEEVNRLFTAFTQADSSTSRTYGGTGLGLSISKQLVELMGGQIGVDSTKGIGSAFWFTVCCQPAKQAVVATDRRVALDRFLVSRPLSILVAEDNEVNQYLIRAILNKLNHSVEIAKDGLCAIELLNSGDFDLILMDIRMPIMDGFEATASIRATEGLKSNIPIIALTADIVAGNINEYTSVGMNNVCGKPIDLPALLKSINKCLDEEIHTSMLHENESEMSQLAFDPVANVEEIGQSASFPRVLLRVAEIVDQTTEQDKDTEISSAFSAIGEDAFTELLKMYEDELKVQCDGFTKAISDLSNKPTDSEVKTKAKELVHSIKGGGGSFGYHLITTIATNADQILKDKENFTPEDIDLLMNHAKALELVSRKKISGNGGKLGRILLQGLDGLS
jgi:PAS domain S-box-containing protein